MKEKIIEKFDEKKFKWYDAYNNDFICINDYPLSDEIKDFISQALDEYADWKIKECLPEKLLVIKDGIGTTEDRHFAKGFNACIDQILLNKDKK